jgi:hypothetical protein
MHRAKTEPLQIDFAGQSAGSESSEEIVQTSPEEQSAAMPNTSWISSFGLALSVAICTLAIIIVQYFYFVPMKQDSQSTSAASTSVSQSIINSFLPTDRNLVSCKSIADGRSIEPNTTCVVNPNETIQTFSAVKIWSYKDQYWVDPPGYTGAGTRTLINPPETQSTVTAPIILTCPWGCTLGYPF